MISRILVAVALSNLILCCSLRPGSLKKLRRESIVTQRSDFSHSIGAGTQKAEFVYLGCGGVLVSKDGDAILVDPFFSNQGTGRIGRSVFLGRNGRENFRSDEDMVAAGMTAIQKQNGTAIRAIISAHSHYDHLMDIPAVYHKLGRKPKLLLTRSGYNIIHKTVDSSHVVIIDELASTSANAKPPYVIERTKGKIHVYPIYSDHNPHVRNVKFFSGEQPLPLNDLTDPYGRTRANLWLEGNTFSFLIDFVNENGEIELRTFIQSSSCNAPAGIPPEELRNRNVDVAFIGIVSYKFSPTYPCELLSALEPEQVVWVHWEDFFRKYTKEPKTVRGTDVPGFFRIPCVEPYKSSGKMLWPRVKMTLDY